MITFDMASLLHWVTAVAWTVAVWVWLALLIDWLLNDAGRHYWNTRQAFLQLAHKLERLGIDLADQAGLIWPWPDSELERWRTTIAVSCADNILPGDVLKLAGTGETLRVVTVELGRLGVTIKQATRSFRALAKAWDAWQDATTPGRQMATGKRN